MPPYVVYGVKYIDLVSLVPFLGGGPGPGLHHIGGGPGASSGRAFTIESGQLVVKRKTARPVFDYESAQAVVVYVTATDNGSPPQTHTARFTVRINNVNEAPTHIALACGCASEPCLNSGTCTAVGLAYQCRCRHGFMGRNCELQPGLQPARAATHYDLTQSACLHVSPTTPVGTRLARIVVSDPEPESAHR